MELTKEIELATYIRDYVYDNGYFPDDKKSFDFIKQKKKEFSKNNLFKEVYEILDGILWYSDKLHLVMINELKIGNIDNGMFSLWEARVKVDFSSGKLDKGIYEKITKVDKFFFMDENTQKILLDLTTDLLLFVKEKGRFPQSHSCDKDEKELSEKVRHNLL